MFPMSFRVPRRLKVLFWRLTDRLRKPTIAPLPRHADDAFDTPAYLRRRKPR